MRNQNSPVVGVTSTPRKFSAVTFRQFSELSRRRNWTAQQLAARFRGRIENPSEFFSRVLSGKSPENLISYRSVIELYNAAPRTLLPFDHLTNAKQGISLNHEPIVRYEVVND